MNTIQIRRGLKTVALLSVLARVDSVGEKAPRLVALRPRCFERDLGIDAE